MTKMNEQQQQQQQQQQPSDGCSDPVPSLSSLSSECVTAMQHSLATTRRCLRAVVSGCWAVCAVVSSAAPMRTSQSR
jgi:hypothetical protein